MRYTATSSDPLPDVVDMSTVSNWLRVDSDTETLAYLIKAAMRWAEGFCDQFLFLRSFTVSLTDFSSCGTLVGVVPDFIVITYDTATLTAQTLPTTAYQLLPSELLRFLPDGVANLLPSSVTITYMAGYFPGSVPEDIILALLLVIGNLYDNRSNPVSEKRTAAENLLQPYKVYSV